MITKCAHDYADGLYYARQGNHKANHQIIAFKKCREFTLYKAIQR